MNTKYDYIIGLHKKKMDFLIALNLTPLHSLFFEKDSYKRRILQIIAYKTTYYEHQAYSEQLKNLKSVKVCFKNIAMFSVRVLKYFIVSCIPTTRESEISTFKCFGFDYLIKKNLSQVSDYFKGINNKFGGKLVLGFNDSYDIDNDNIRTSRDPLAECIKQIPFFHIHRITLIFNILKSSFEFLRNIVKDPLYSHFEKDYAFLPFIIAINGKPLKNYVIITSDYYEQLLPFTDLRNKKFVFHYLNYSVNHFCLASKECKDIVEHPSYYFLKADVTWCWNQIQSDWIKKITQSKDTLISGANLFINPTQSYNVNKFQKKRVMVFDVAPQNDSWFKNTIGNTGDHFYYSNENCKKFILDLVECAKPFKDIQLLIKSKREYNHNHCTDYIKIIKDVESDNVLLIDSTVNLLDEIKEVDLIISIPFSSPTFLGKEHGIESLFYDPSDSLNPRFIEGKVDFISTKDELTNLFSNLSK